MHAFPTIPDPGKEGDLGVGRLEPIRDFRLTLALLFKEAIIRHQAATLLDRFAVCAGRAASLDTCIDARPLLRFKRPLVKPWHEIPPGHQAFEAIIAVADHDWRRVRRRLIVPGFGIFDRRFPAIARRIDEAAQVVVYLSPRKLMSVSSAHGTFLHDRIRGSRRAVD